MQHAKKNTGEANHFSRIKERDVRAIRLLHATGWYTAPELAKMFKVSRELAYKIVGRKIWRFA